MIHDFYKIFFNARVILFLFFVIQKKRKTNKTTEILQQNKKYAKTQKKIIR